MVKIYIAYTINDGGHLGDSINGYYLSKEKARQACEYSIDELGNDKPDYEPDYIDTDDLKNSSVSIDMEEDE